MNALAVHKMFEVCGRARVDLFASEDNSHCPIFFTKSTDALAHEWPSLPLYAFPPIALPSQLLRRVREQWHKLILIAPLWRNHPWVSELFQLLKAAPWPIPLRRDLPLSSERHDMASTARIGGQRWFNFYEAPEEWILRILVQFLLGLTYHTERSASYRKSEQLFIGFSNRAKVALLQSK